MQLKYTLFTLLWSSLCLMLDAQTATLNGQVLVDGEPMEYAQIMIDSLQIGAITDQQGAFAIANIPAGEHSITASYIGYTKISKVIELAHNQSMQLNFELNEQSIFFDDIVVTGTKTNKRQTESPVIVNVINSETLTNIQACNLAEGLKFQPGLRVETDCQTCNYTQLRMNGLAGGYSQILINGRPIFSPLTGLYGLEQLPSNMIDRIEIVRGGGSSLYGSSAIGGTVNVITTIPKSNSYALDYTYQNIDAQTSDHIINGNATVVSDSRNFGASFFGNLRQRGFYDANGDNFSEIPLVENIALGANMFYLPKENQKLEFSLSNIYEYRLGGEMFTDVPVFQLDQAEERTHQVWMASADYQINFNNENSSFISYAAWQNTDRDHYTGIRPDDDAAELGAFLADPPFGISDVSTFNVGLQLNHKLNNFLGGVNTFTLGTEYIYDDVLDDIPAYNYLIDQTSKNFGTFLQSDWAITSSLTLLSGVRMDQHNLVDGLVFSPRASLLYKLKQNTQFRLSYGSGFRAPQAFDTDLHIAFAGGGISRVSLSPELAPEYSQSYSASINYDKPSENWIAGFTLEGFYNRLEDAFILQPIGSDAFGEVFEKQNSGGATVQGITLELRANYDRKLQIEGGFTLQSADFDTPVQYIDGLAGITEFVRTPNDYGYAILTYTPNDRWNATINYVYTGRMLVPHFASDLNIAEDEIFTSPSFSDLSTKIGYTIPIKKLNNFIEFFGGVKNIFNAYQDDFDIGKERDSNFIYGPAQPRTFFVGFKFRG